MATVVLLGTLDTKGKEYAYLRDRLREEGVDVLLVDAGVFAPQVEADVPNEEVAAAGGADVGALAEAGDRGAAVDTMGRGAAEVVLYTSQHDATFSSLGETACGWRTSTTRPG